MATTLDLTTPIRRHQKVVTIVDLPGVPEGTQGKVRVANGFSWYRYWVDFDNGVKLGQVDHGDIVKASDWDRFQIERSKTDLEVNGDEADPNDRDSYPSDDEAVGNRFGVPDYLLERSREARTRLGA